MRTLQACIGPVNRCYCQLHQHMQAMECYEEVCLDDFSPEDHYARRHWLDGISLPFPAMHDVSFSLWWSSIFHLENPIGKL